jgi:sugar phosphate permease
MQQPKHTVDVQDFIDSQRFSPFQWTILVLCFLVVAADGFDTAAVGFIAPSLVQDWGVARSALGPVMSAALVGLGIGALGAGPLADRFGRKTVLVLSVFFFGLWSLAAARAGSIESLTALRFMTGAWTRRCNAQCGDLDVRICAGPHSRRCRECDVLRFFVWTCDWWCRVRVAHPAFRLA